MESALSPDDPALVPDAESRVAHALARRLHGRVPPGLSDQDLDRALEAFLHALPRAKDPAAEALGPFYDTAGLMAWLGISRQAVHQRAQDLKLVAVPTSSPPRRTLYPAWQFRGDGSTVAGVGEVLEALAPTGWDPITTAAWFMGTAPGLDDMSPSQWLTEGRSVEDVVDVAHRDVGAWHR